VDRRERVANARASVAVWLIAITGLSVALRIVLLAEVHGPWVFMDELGYQKLAQSLGQNGHLALFDKRGLSLSPLYSVVLAPIYALGASAPVAYHWIKIVNAVLMSLSIFPVYMIARFVLPRRSSLVAAALSAFAPLMYYSALAMSENLAYPLFLASVWAMLVAVRSPSRRADAVLLISIAAASAARLQLIVLFPAALTAVVLARALARKQSEKYMAGLLSDLWRQHRLLIGSAAGFLVVLATGRAFALTGIYGGALKDGFPNVWRVLEQIVRHLAGLDLAVGVIPFVGALVAAYAFLKYGARRDVGVFASVAVSVTAWLLVEVGFFGDFVVRTAQIPRIHERYLFYVLPLFVIALLAVVRLPASKAPFRTYEAAAVVAAALPAVIPFRSVVNNTIVSDSFALQPYGKAVGSTIVPVAHATFAAVCIAGLFAFIFVLLRNRMVAVGVVVLLVFVFMSALVRSRVVEAARGATAAVLPAHRDWVDRTKPSSGVALVAGPGASDLAVFETAFNNLSILRVYYICAPTFGAIFGEQRIWADRTGRLRDAAGYVNVGYIVAPVGLSVRGRVIARDRRGHLVLVAPPNGRVRVPTAKRGTLNCASP
jgi:Dolichyl-phosphate-mannose-protein mannosyltransferase